MVFSRLSPFLNGWILLHWYTICIFSFSVLVYLDSFYPLAIRNRVSINIFVQDCVDLSFSFSWVYTSNGISGLGCNCMANHLKSCHASPSYVPSSDGGSSFSTSTPPSHLTFVSISVSVTWCLGF